MMLLSCFLMSHLHCHTVADQRRPIGLILVQEVKILEEVLKLELEVQLMHAFWLSLIVLAI